MEDANETDAPLSKPVSSLRSQYESLSSSRASTPGLPGGALTQKPTALTGGTPLYASSTSPPRTIRPASCVVRDDETRDGGRHPNRARAPLPTSSSRPRPVSMLSASPQVSPSHSPASLGRSTRHADMTDARSTHQTLERSLLTPGGLSSDTPNAHPSYHSQAHKHHSSDKLPSPALNALDIAAGPPEQRLLERSGSPVSTAPPKINRSAKPQISAKGPVYLGGSLDAAADPSPMSKLVRVKSGGGDFAAPPVPVRSKPIEAVHSDNNAKLLEARPTRHTIPSRGDSDSENRLMPKLTATHQSRAVSRGREEEKAPALPPRRDTSGPKISASRSPALELPGRPSALTQGFSFRSVKASPVPSTVTAISASPNESRPRPVPLPARPKATTLGSNTPYPTSPVNNASSSAPPRHSSYNEEKRPQSASNTLALNAITMIPEIPQSSSSNRRSPNYRDGPRQISTGYDAKLLDVCGEYVCTSGTVTRVWNVLTGKLLLSLPQAENVKITAMAFKPARNIEDEGSRLWLGTNWGEIQEIDISSKKIVATNATAHNRREVVKIHRHAAELWTIDDEGKLYVWPAGTNGSPNLEIGVQNPKLPRGRTGSLAVGARLWYVCSKDIRVFAPSSNPGVGAFQLSDGTFSQPDLGDVTSCAILSTQPDQVYFGHSDGRITVYSRKDFKLKRVVHISNHKISCLIGASKYLWAGLTTGRIYVYDTTSRPWKTKKARQPHDSPVTSLVVDRSSIWKLDRLQVLSLGVDNAIGVWDGMLEDDWLENDLQTHQAEYCTFWDATALVVTWNAGASTPGELRYEDQDRNFFRDVLHEKHFPDILVFGLQELVDLEDKALTAKSFFKSRSKDPYGQEQLSSVYRAWRDFFTRTLDEATSQSDSYSLVSTSSLVGLFTCVFVRSSQRGRYRDLHTAEVKTGMGGLHGNKGALLVRLLCDDSSMCFVNCHLAAGQSQTANRNQDVSTILEHAHLAHSAGPGNYPETYVYGGDGSMVIDYELCILNGDLNYRIDTMTRDAITNVLKGNNLEKLLDRDQLLLSQRRNPGFYLRNFDEGQITFAPTYKYDVGTDEYDTSDKRRSPAWCDRVLFRGGNKIQQLDYRRHEIRVSDHRPVSSLFRMKIKTIQKEKRAQCWQGCIQRYEKFKLHASTQAKLDYLTHVFGLSPAEAKRRLEAE